MSRLYVNQTLEKQIRQYCELNGIEDINAFANRCLSQGFNVVKFGSSPKNNMERELKGIKDPKETEKKIKKTPIVKEIPRQIENEVKTNDIPKENKVEQVTVRKIKVIKKK